MSDKALDYKLTYTFNHAKQYFYLLHSKIIKGNVLDTTSWAIQSIF